MEPTQTRLFHTLPSWAPQASNSILCIKGVKEAKYHFALDGHYIFCPAPSENATSTLDSLKMCYIYLIYFGVKSSYIAVRLCE